MRAGRLNQRIELQAKTSGVYQGNQMGERRYAWETYDTVWAGEKNTRGGESVNSVANETQATREVVFEIRYHSSVTEGHRIHKTVTLSGTFTADDSTDQLTATGHIFINEDKVTLSTTDTLPAGLSIDTTYFVIMASGGSFKLSDTLNGNPIDITDTGTGTHTVTLTKHRYLDINYIDNVGDRNIKQILHCSEVAA